VNDGRLGQLYVLDSQPLLLRSVELNLLDRCLELGLNPFASVASDERRVFTHNILRTKIRLLLLLVARDVKLGISLQQGTSVGSQLLAGELLFDQPGVGRIAEDRRCSSGEMARWCFHMLVIVRHRTSPLADSFFQLRYEQGDIARDFRLPPRFKSRR